MEGIANCLFINAQNKQTIHSIVKPLRELGIPAAAIFDIDVIKEGGEVFLNILRAAQIPVGLHETFQNLRSRIYNNFKNTKKDMKRDGGINLLSSDQQEVFRKFIKDFAEYGVFILENGEVESWLKFLECSGHGPEWLIKIFTAIGDDQNSETYINPCNSDVWKFIEIINAWFKDSGRKGVS